MILVNISAVCTSTTLTWMPVSFSHIGPEKFFGSSDCRPASQTMLIVVPLYFWASFTAVSAALSAIAADAQVIASPAAAPAHATLLISLMVSLPFIGERAAAFALLSPRRPRAAGVGVYCQPPKRLRYASSRALKRD